MTAIPASGYWSSNGRIQSESKQWGEDIRNVIAEIIGGSAQSSTVNLASNTFTPVAGTCCYAVETAGGGATDTLNTITTTNVRDGEVILIRSVNNAHVITVANAATGTGQILTADGNNIVLNNTKNFIALKYNLAITSFEEIFRAIPISSGGGGGAASISYGGVKTASFTAALNTWYDINLASATADIVMTLPDPTTGSSTAVSGIVQTQITGTSTTYAFGVAVATTTGSQTIDNLSNGNYPERSDLRGRTDFALVGQTWRTQLS